MGQEKNALSVGLFHIFKSREINVLSGILTTREIISFQNYRDNTFDINLQQENAFPY